jgi:hypothetical protein
MTLAEWRRRKRQEDEEKAERKKKRNYTDEAPEIPVIGKRELFRRALEKGTAVVTAAMDHSNKLGAGADKRKGLSPDDKFAAVMREFHRGTLHSSDGKIVTDPAQAKAIAASESGKTKKGELRQAIRKAFDPDKHPRAGGKFDAHANDTNKVKMLKDGTRRVFVKSPDGTRLRKYWKPGQQDATVPEGQPRPVNTLLKRALEKSVRIKGKAHPGSSIKKPLPGANNLDERLKLPGFRGNMRNKAR